ncbi:MAG: hypothetical protein C4325_12730 [Blastocatellia bacterium]
MALHFQVKCSRLTAHLNASLDTEPDFVWSLSEARLNASVCVLTGGSSPQSVFGIQKSRFERVHARIALSLSKRFCVVEGFKGVAAIFRGGAFGFL